MRVSSLIAWYNLAWDASPCGTMLPSRVVHGSEQRRRLAASVARSIDCHLSVLSALVDQFELQDDLLTALAAQMKDLRQVSRCISASPAGFTNSSPVVSGNGTMAAKMPQLLDCEF